VSGDVSRLFREKLENAAAGYSDKLAHLDLLRCPMLTELLDTSLIDAQKGGNLFRPQQCFAV
jgi:hypothetical protein